MYLLVCIYCTPLNGDTALKERNDLVGGELFYLSDITESDIKVIVFNQLVG